MPESELLEMVNYLKHTGYIRSESIEEAMLAVDRAYFVPSDYEGFAYSDNALPMGYNQTISAPSVVAFMLEALQLKPGMKVLEIGTGSGYNSALISHILGRRGKITTVEIVPELFDIAKNNISKMKNLQDNVQFICGDGNNGYEKDAPYERIIVTASMPALLPDNPLIKQLKKNGKLIAPVGDRNQNLVLYDNRTKTSERILSVMFVPLTGKTGVKE